MEEIQRKMMQLSTKPNKKRQRLVIVDGMNVMRGFQNLINGLQHSTDLRMNAIVLLQIIHGMTKHGFRVRIALKRYPEPFEVFHMYILEELNRMQLIIYPEVDFEEADDEMMLGLAERYGAVIISNDRFSNHHRYREIANKSRIEFKKVKNPKFSVKELQRRLIFENKFVINGDNKNMYTSEGDPDYENVLESYDIFWPLTRLDSHALDALLKYVHCQICCQMGYRISPKLKFFDENDESCPMKFEDFKKSFKK